MSLCFIESLKRASTNMFCPAQHHSVPVFCCLPIPRIHSLRWVLQVTKVTIYVHSYRYPYSVTDPGGFVGIRRRYAKLPLLILVIDGVYCVHCAAEGHMRGLVPEYLSVVFSCESVDRSGAQFSVNISSLLNQTHFH